MRPFTIAPMVALTVLLAGCGTRSSSTGSTPEPPSPTDTPTASSIDTPTDPAYVALRVETGAKPCGILGAAGKVWVSDFGDDELVAIDPDSGTVGKPTKVGASPCGLASGAGSIWVEDYGSNQVTRVSTATGRVQATYAVGSAPYDVTFAAGAAWVTDYTDGDVARIDARTGRVTRIPIGDQPIGIAPAAGHVWIGTRDGIVAIDTRTGRVDHRIATQDPATWTADDPRHVWVAVGSSVVQVDPTTARITRTVAIGPKPADGTVVGDRVWFGDQGGALYVFSKAGGPASSYPSGVGDPFVAAGYRGMLWLADFGGTDVVRIDPAVVS